MLVKKIIKTTGILMFWVALWQIAATLINPSLLVDIPTPLDTLNAMLRLLSTAEFWISSLMSVLRIICGFVLAVVIGTVCAVISYKSPLFKAFTAPLLFITRSVPVASFIMLVFLWLTKGEIPIFISFLMVLPIIWSNMETGLASVDVKLKEMATVFGFSRYRIFKEITFPSLKPYFSSALITGLGFAWKSGVAAEVIARTGNSIGELLWVSKSAIDYAEVFALTVVIVILSVILENILKLFLRGKRHD